MLDKKGKVPKHNLYATNQSITSKYTIITFVPRNLFEQVSSSFISMASQGGQGKGEKRGEEGGGGARGGELAFSPPLVTLFGWILDWRYIHHHHRIRI